MWLATKFGFYSIVKSSINSDDYMIRGRIRNDLENIRNHCDLEQEVIETSDSDYRYRLIINKTELLDVMTKLGEALDYNNFKGKIGVTTDQKDKLYAYHKVWSIMYEFQ